MALHLHDFMYKGGAAAGQFVQFEMPLLASGLPQFCESCCPCGLHCAISGLLAGGSPGFRSVLCWFLYSQSSCMAVFVIVACFVLLGLTAG